MGYCAECGTEIVEGQDHCAECGASVETSPETEDSFMDRYGAEPLPFAEGRSELVSIYGKVLGAIPVLGGIMKLFVGLVFWCNSINLKILTAITMGADVMKRLTADFKYIKDSFYSGYNGEERPPAPQ